MVKATKLNLLNSFSLIIIGLWGYVYSSSLTALIPVGFGLVLFLCHTGIKRENKIISHIAVMLTLIILLALIGMRLPKSIDNGGLVLYRVVFMIFTSSLSMLGFIKSFINARKSKH